MTTTKGPDQADYLASTNTSEQSRLVRSRSTPMRWWLLVILAIVILSCGTLLVDHMRTYRPHVADIMRIIPKAEGDDLVLFLVLADARGRQVRARGDVRVIICEEHTQTYKKGKQTWIRYNDLMLIDENFAIDERGFVGGLPFPGEMPGPVLAASFGPFPGLRTGPPRSADDRNGLSVTLWFVEHLPGTEGDVLIDPSRVIQRTIMVHHP